MDQFNNFLILLDANLSGSWWFPALLIGTGIFFTIYLGFPQFKYFSSALKIVSGKNNSESEGETTGFQALTTAMSGAVGTGNIASANYDGQFRSDYEYVSGSGDLDECNGMTVEGQYGTILRINK